MGEFIAEFVCVVVVGSIFLALWKAEAQRGSFTEVEAEPFVTFLDRYVTGADWRLMDRISRPTRVVVSPSGPPGVPTGTSWTLSRGSGGRRRRRFVALDHVAHASRPSEEHSA